MFGSMENIRSLRCAHAMNARLSTMYFPRWSLFLKTKVSLSASKIQLSNLPLVEEIES